MGLDANMHVQLTWVLYPCYFMSTSWSDFAFCSVRYHSGWGITGGVTRGELLGRGPKLPAFLVSHLAP